MAACFLPPYITNFLMIQIQTFTFNAFQENMYVLYDQTGECVIIDPGCYDKQRKAGTTKLHSG
jgi:glyoxylase-like metal-dependent hydrolase (beta-lactamase superfamily II)